MNSWQFLSHKGSVQALASALIRLTRRDKLAPVILCIGSDRLTGDSLGPLVGTHLTRLHSVPTYVYGTLSSPVNAKNLTETYAFIKSKHPKTKLLVVDASLGLREDIGMIRLSKGGVLPGSGVNRVLPKVGDYSITSVVSELGRGAEALAATRLGQVYPVSEIIAAAISECLTMRKALFETA